MGKKKQNKLNKLLKHRQLQQLGSGQVVMPALPDNPIVAPSRELIAPVVVAALPATPSYLGREITRTLISLSLIIILLLAAVVADRHTHYFADFGAWLYRTLRLANK